MTSHVKYLTTREIALHLGCGVNRVRSLVAIGMPHVRFSRGFRFITADVDRWMAKHYRRGVK
jgi:excisionase family DNA binding protein